MLSKRKGIIIGGVLFAIIIAIATTISKNENLTGRFANRARIDAGCFRCLPIRTSNEYPYPNPFNPDTAATAINFTLSGTATVDVQIFRSDAALRHNPPPLKTLYRSTYNPISGVVSLPWDGRDENGNPVAAGRYVFRIIANGVPTSNTQGRDSFAGDVILQRGRAPDPQPAAPAGSAQAPAATPPQQAAAALPEINFERTTYSYNEGHTRRWGTYPAVFVVRAPNAISQNVNVEFEVIGGTATARTDFTFPATPPVATFYNRTPPRLNAGYDVNIVDDSVREGNETIILRLKSVTPPVFSIGPKNTTTITITDND